MRVVVACVLAVILVVGPSIPLIVQASPTELFFSEYIEGTSNNKALEIFNGTPVPVDLAAGRYNVQMFFNGSASAGVTINLSGTVATGDVFVLAQSLASTAIKVQADQTSSVGWFNGNDAVVLRKGGPTGPIVDVIGQIGVDPGPEWGTGLTSTADNTLRRKLGIQAGDVNGSDPFDPTVEWDGFATDTFEGLGIHPGTAPVPPTLPIGTVQGAVSDAADGRTHRSPFAAPSGNNAGQTVRVQGVIYQKTQTRTSGGGVNHGVFIQNTASAADADPNTSNGLFVFMGGFSDLLREDGGSNYVPQVGDEIVLSGHVTEFFNLTELAGPFLRLVSVMRTGVSIDTEVAPYDVKPPDVLADAHRYWERREGMRGKVPANSLVVGRREVFTTTMDGEVWVIRPDHQVALRRDPFARRVFRDPHPLDDVSNNSDDDDGISAALFDNGNGYRILLGSLGIKATTNDRNALIDPARTFDRVTQAVEGGTYFAFNKYSIMPRVQITLSPGPDPNANAPVPSYDPTVTYRVTTYNVENLYDFRDDPFDGCDFGGNSGCSGVNPPFDYVPDSDAVYRARLSEIAHQIRFVMGSPDIILVQEAEDQDVCVRSGSTLVCGTTNNADGEPDTLQDLALAIESGGGPEYRAAADRDGADDRGIISAFLFRADRVQLHVRPDDAQPGDPVLQPTNPVLGSTPQVVYRSQGSGYNGDFQNPKVLNSSLPADVDRSTGTDGDLVYTRPPQVGLFRVWRDGIGTEVFVDLYVLSNHFSSTPDARVGQRTEQARYAAAIVHALKKPAGERVIVGGDLNVYPRPDDPFTPGHLLFPSDQLAPLYDAGLKNLWTRLLATKRSAAYSYVFEGQTQTLDQLFVTARLRSELARVWAAHVNSDWPQDYSGDGPRGSSDHDPQGADFEFGRAPKR